MFGWITGKKGKKTPSKKEGETYHIAQGNIKIDKQRIDALSFAIDEGYSDQAIIDIGKSVTQEIMKAQKQLEKVV